jgi:parallel beta-helix repeat protein
MRTITVLAMMFVLAVPGGASAVPRFVNPNDTCTPEQVLKNPEYDTIQDAHDDSSPGDTIFVCPGTYTEKVVIGVGSLALLALGPVVLAGSGGGACVEVTADRVTVRGFEIRDCFTGIFVDADHAFVGNNVLHHNGIGLLISGLRNLAQNNRAHSNNDGILVSGASDGTVVRNNTVRENTIGIGLESSSGATAEKNVVQRNGLGIRTGAATACVISFNRVAFNVRGISLGVGTDEGSEGCLVTRNNVSQSTVPPDCVWDGLGANTFSKNNCASEVPLGAWD